MGDVTVKAGDNVALVWTFDADLDTDTASLSITGPSPAVTVVVGPTAVGVAKTATTGVYAYVWSVGSAQAAGTYTATLSGHIAGEDVSEVVKIYVASRYLYVALTTVKDELGLDSATTGHDAQLLRHIGGASRAAEIACSGRRFYRDASGSARIYESTDRIVRLAGVGDVALIDDFATTDGLIVETGDGGSNWSTVASSSYSAYPLNALAKGEAAYGILLRASKWLTPFFRVTVPWGWPAEPTELGEAVLFQSMRYFSRRTSPEGVKGSAEWGGVITIPRLDPDVRALIEHLAYPQVG